MQSITKLEEALNVKFPNNFEEKMDYISNFIFNGETCTEL